LAERVKDSLGTVIVENRPGAGGNIGADFIAKAAPDGLTIGIAATATHAVNPWLYSRIPYNAATDFAPITQILRVPNVLVMNTDTAKRLNIFNLSDFIRYAKAHPGQLNYGSGGNGSAGHLAGELFKSRAGIFAVHIPYNGGNPAQLAHGISIALYNTAFGLMIAIPSLMFHRYFRGRMEEYVLELEAAADRLLGQLRRYTA
jgi:tripartite-type tricarboxylate transporter receptor subunit TctC